VYALKKFRGYIEGSPIVVRTDHESLKYFHTQRYLGRRLAPFHDDISHFDVQIIYRPGRSQAAADALSRRKGHADVPDSEYEPLYVHASELKPAEHEAIFGTLEGYRTNLLKGGVVANGNYSVRGKILYKNISTDNSPPPQYVVPTSFKNALELVSALHTDLGHLGINAVQGALRDRAWMPFSTAIVEHTVRTCNHCQFTRWDQTVPQSLHPLPRVEACDLWAFDFIGPLPKTKMDNQIKCARTIGASQLEAKVYSGT
jgi:hypothetical protein